MSEQLATVRFGRLEQRGLLLGFSAAQTAALTVGLFVAVLAEYAGGAFALLMTAPVWGLSVTVALVSVQGRPVMGWLPIVHRWGVRRSLSQHRFLADAGRWQVADRLMLPGVGALTVVDGPVTGAALLHDPRASTLTALLAVDGAGFVLAEVGIQQNRVAGWSRLLAGLCHQPSVVRLQVLHRSVPGGATAVRAWWSEHALAGAPWAARVLADLVADAGDVSDRHESLLAVAIRCPKGGRKAPGPAAVAVVEKQLAGLADAARAAELTVQNWVDRDTLARTLRSVFDPTNPTGGADLRTAGPTGVEEAWASLTTDTARHATYWVAQWPRSEVHCGFLQPLLLAPGAYRSLSITAEPVASAKALREIRRARVEHAADSAQRARSGQLEDEATREEVADVVRRERQLVAGHGDLAFVGLLTVTATTADGLDEACAAVEAAAAQAMCELRRLVGQQAHAFAAGALPLARSAS